LRRGALADGGAPFFKIARDRRKQALIEPVFDKLAAEAHKGRPGVLRRGQSQAAKACSIVERLGERYHVASTSTLNIANGGRAFSPLPPYSERAKPAPQAQNRSKKKARRGASAARGSHRKVSCPTRRCAMLPSKSKMDRIESWPHPNASPTTRWRPGLEPFGKIFSAQSDEYLRRSARLNHHQFGGGGKGRALLDKSKARLGLIAHQTLDRS
jgi:hypothetical protein